MLHSVPTARRDNFQLGGDEKIMKAQVKFRKLIPYLAILVLVLLFRPQGILGRKAA